MALSLEHFKLLNPKANQFWPGTGGTPDITWQEVCDVLATVPSLCRAYARYQYAQDKRFAWVLVEEITREMADDDRKKKRSLWPDQLMWLRFAEMAVFVYSKGMHLTRKQKAEELGIRFWTRKHEESLRLLTSALDELDYELRVALRKWNRHQEVTCG
jgi:hypothetical protein